MKQVNLTMGHHGYSTTIKTTIVEIIDENFIVVEYYQLNLIFSVKDQMFNATKLVRSISSSEIKTWNETKAAKLFKQRFPKFFKVIGNKDVKGTDIHRVSGTYMDMTMIPVITAWCNPMIGYFIANNLSIDEKNDLSGFVYLIQPEEHLGTNIYKIGRTWNPDQRIRQYGSKTNIIKCVKVDNMFLAETMIIQSFKSLDIHPSK
jgi:hypothetical protein